MPGLPASADLALLGRLGIAGAAGFLIGFEREWTHALEKRERSFAGARTFTLVGVIGGAAGALSDGPFLIAAALLIVGGLTIASYVISAREPQGLGGTTEMAIFATLLLGAAAGRGELLLAAAGGVVVTIFLSLKSEISQWAKSLDEREIHAALRFLAIAVLVLPVLPDRHYGPYDAINPRELWTMVVLISGLSFIGYWLMKLLGGGHGVLATGVIGGLASSTATTLALSGFARDGSAAPAVIASGVVMANVVMLARVAIIIAAVSKATFALLAPALAAGAVAGVVFAWLLWRSSARALQPAQALELGNPFELRPALIFAGLLAVVGLASSFGVARFGEAGLYAIGFLSGLADVDAMTLSGGRQAAMETVQPATAAGAILLALLANVIVKGAMTLVIGGRRAGIPVIAGFALMLIAAFVALVALR